ncbi:MAG: histidinol-phosphatase HisJ family protein [Clostridiales Family XIII bacterium]|jgi:histidinol-phosphatase (PHP family)|nr:histidinol-phosphatase HisJ family protein [Clostridiales Family XIII bacterium]
MYDYHLHTGFSYDAGAEASIDLMVRRAIELGLDGIAVTDHYDPEFADLNWSADLDFPNYHATLDRVVAQYGEAIDIARGIELGMQPGEPNALCAAAASDYPYDFIIGSVHCACGAAIDTRAYHAGRNCKQAVHDYYDDLLRCITEFGDFDVLGHINVIERYIDGTPHDDDFMDIAEVILKKLIDEGKGIEINTSSFRYGMGERTTPTPTILRRYVELGGEIVTTGSDAHRARDVGAMIDFAEQMIRDAGLRYIATFKARKPVMIRL